jgi:uncharacterized NAD-dependent epimerase/dehydratase family protein
VARRAISVSVHDIDGTQQAQESNSPGMIEKPYIVFLGDVHDDLAAKTAFGIVDWRPDWCIGQVRLPGCQANTGLPDMSIADAANGGARTFVIGVVNSGGILPDHWVTSIVEAIEAGMDVASGLHIRLESIPAIGEAAAKAGVSLHNVRHADRTFATGNGIKRGGRRLVTVGTDCATGKKYTALAMEAALRAAGADAEFRATGQTGILIAAGGVAIDAVPADFISGVVEWLSPEAADDHWDVIEGQGSLFHPAFAGVSLGLLHGAQPDAFIVCHEPTRTTMRNVEHPLPTIAEVIDLTIGLGGLTNPAIRCVGLSVNTAALDEAAAQDLLATLEGEHGVPAIDPVRFADGPGRIAEHILTLFRA